MGILKVLLILLVTIILSGCSIVSMREDFTVEPIMISNEMVSSEKVEYHVVWNNGTRSETLDESKTGKEIIGDLLKVNKLFTDSKVVGLTVVVNPIKNLSGSCPECRLIWPETISAEVEVRWVAHYRDGRDREIAARSVPYKQYTEILYFPYGLVMLFIRPIMGEWDNGLGFGRNLLGHAVPDRESVRINHVMIQDLGNKKIDPSPKS